MKTISIKFKGRKYKIRDYAICDNIFSKARGLMFREKNYQKPLLFVWRKPYLEPIHSFFCRKFLAVWMLKGRIIEERTINPWKISVTPKGKFDWLLEIPLEYFEHRR